MPKINERAIVDKDAEIGEGVCIGPFTIVEKDVTIGKGSWIGANVFIASGTRIGRDCKIYYGAVLGTTPQDFKYKGEKTFLEVGDRTVIREYCTIHRATPQRWTTRIGKDCYLMCYVHVAHDCQLGDNVILANAVNMGGHVTMEDYVGVGGIVPIHQFVRIGQHSFIGGGYRVPKDVPPYILAGGEPLTYKGLNIVGLTRRGFSKQTLLNIHKAYKLIYRSHLNLSQALNRIKEELELSQEIKNIIEFIENSERGIIG